MSIATFIKAKLTRLNNEHPGIEKIDEGDYYNRYLNSIRDFNNTVSKMAVTIDGEDLTEEQIKSVQVPIPQIKRAVTRYECTASGNENAFFNKGRTFILEVS